MTDTQMKSIAPSLNTKSAIQTLSELASGINTNLKAIADAMHGSVMRAFEAGELLRQAKAKLVVHGEWEQWLEVNCKLSVRTAQRYMKLAENRHAIESNLRTKSATVADITLRQAERLLTAQSNSTQESNSRRDSNVSTVDDRPSELGSIHKLRGELVGALKKLKLSDKQKASEEAHRTVEHLRLADLIEVTA